MIVKEMGQTLIRFSSYLGGRLHHTSIKVYLSVVHSLHIDNGPSDRLPFALPHHTWH